MTQECNSPVPSPRALETFLTSLPRLALGTFPTPLVPLERIGRDLGIELWMKREDCTGLGMGGNKARKLEFILADARAKRHDTVVTTGPLTSNHNMMTAAAARRCGFDVHCVVGGAPPEHPSGNLLLLDYLGAHLHFSPIDLVAPSREDFEGLQRVCREVVDRTGGYWIPAGGSMPEAEPGYMSAVLEITRQRNDVFDFDHVVLAIGTGSTTTGVLLGLALGGGGARVWAVAAGRHAAARDVFRRPTPDVLFLRSAEHFGLPLTAADVPPHEVVFGFAEEGYGVPNERSDRAIRLLARQEGYLLDPVYTAKAFSGLLAMVEDERLSRGARVLFIHTGGLAMTPAAEKRYAPRLSESAAASDGDTRS